MGIVSSFVEGFKLSLTRVLYFVGLACYLGAIVAMIKTASSLHPAILIASEVIIPAFYFGFLFSGSVIFSALLDTRKDDDTFATKERKMRSAGRSALSGSILFIVTILLMAFFFLVIDSDSRHGIAQVIVTSSTAIIIIAATFADMRYYAMLFNNRGYKDYTSEKPKEVV